MDVFEKRSVSKVEVVPAGRIILQAIYSTEDERRDDLDINQIRSACYKDKLLQDASNTNQRCYRPSLSSDFPTGATVNGVEPEPSLVCFLSYC